MVVLATAAGAAAAMHIGKAAAALPRMQAELSLTLAQAAVYLAVISVSAALTGFAIGRVASGLGVVRAGMIGLMLMAAASLTGAAAGGLAGLMTARIVEAIGLSLVVTTMPAIVQGATREADRPLALGIWAAWMPLGVAASMAAAFLLLDGTGWRVLYLLCALVSAGVAGLLHLRRGRVAGRAVGAPPFSVRLPGLRHPLYRMAVVFCMFSAANMIFMGFLPSVVQTSMGGGTGMATGIAFVAALLLLPTNIGTGLAVGRGVARQRLLWASFAGIALGGAVVFAPGLPTALRLAAALLLALSTGIAPALVWSAVPALAGDADVPPPLVAGVLYQAAGLGQVAGPILAGTAVEALHGWHGAALVIAACAVCAITVSAASRREAGFR